MKDRKDENLKQLFERFVASEDAQKAPSEIAQAEKYLDMYQAPIPSNELLDDIKNKVAKAVEQQKSSVFHRAVYNTAAIAAAFIIIAVISVKLSERQSIETRPMQTASIIPLAIWESDDLETDDAGLAVSLAEINQIQDDIIALQLGEDAENGQTDLTDLEMELVEINSNFWKG